MEGRTHGIGEQRSVVFGAKNEMDVDTGEGLRHDMDRPFRAWARCAMRSQGAALGLNNAPRWGAP